MLQVLVDVGGKIRNVLRHCASSSLGSLASRAEATREHATDLTLVHSQGGSDLALRHAISEEGDNDQSLDSSKLVPHVRTALVACRTRHLELLLFFDSR